MAGHVRVALLVLLCVGLLCVGMGLGGFSVAVRWRIWSGSYPAARGGSWMVGKDLGC